ncbi:TPA: transcriptional repressor [Candidatus Micrarchaeota archaeon]|nr:transcriptional repressor [Candidatus Micrarchaeota archaeon]
MHSYMHNHNHCIHTALNTAERLCRERGVRLTPLRRKVLELIWADHRAVKAYDLLELLGEIHHNAKPATVYRALDFLAEQGLIHRVESLNAFIGCNCCESPHDSLLLICRRCGDVKERPAPGVMAALAAEATRTGFLLEHMAVEVIGTCAHCAKRRG